MFERVYTVGCFDHFHQGHINLLTSMKKLGRRIIAGIHDDTSLKLLKNLSPDEHDPIEVRMAKLRAYVDQVYVIPDRDPTFFLQCMVLPEDNLVTNTSCYARADDMPNFPGRKFIETRMEIFLIPYTKGISSTEIRKKLKEKKEKSKKHKHRKH